MQDANVNMISNKRSNSVSCIYTSE